MYNPQNEMFEKIKRSVSFRKTKCFFFGFPPYNEKTPQISLGRFCFHNPIISSVQVKLHILVTIEQLACTLYIVLVYVYIAEVQRYRLQGQIYLSCHKVQVVYVSW